MHSMYKYLQLNVAHTHRSLKTIKDRVCLAPKYVFGRICADKTCDERKIEGKSAKDKVDMENCSDWRVFGISSWMVACVRVCGTYLWFTISKWRVSFILPHVQHHHLTRLIPHFLRIAHIQCSVKSQRNPPHIYLYRSSTWYHSTFTLWMSCV